MPPEQAARALREASRAVSVHVHICITIAAPPDAVWQAVERIETHTEWMLDAERITFRTEQHDGVGAEFDCLTRVGPLHTTDRFVVTRWEPGEAMGIEHRGAVTGVGEFRLRPLAGGDEHRLLLGGELAFPWWLGSVAGERLGRPVLKRIWEGNLRRLKAKVEGRPLA